MAQMFATKGNLIGAKRSLALSDTGFDLLDRKRSILIREMMELLDRSKALRGEIDDTYRDAYDALRRANITLGSIENVAQAAPLDNGVEIHYRSVMGVDIPVCEYTEPPGEMSYGFRGTNSQLDKAYHSFRKVTRMTVMLTELENSAFRLARAIVKTQRRANALKNVSIPRLQGTIKTITEVLEEKDREEFSRLKVIKKQAEE
jgi:V/A-type H+-transporting ATPase subunit D